MQTDVKVVMITGAAGNLGRAAAQAFARDGARLVLLDVGLDALAAAYPEPTADRLLVAADLLQESSVQRAVDAARERFQRIDVLCNIAGGFHYGSPVHQMAAEELRRSFDLNALTLFNAVRFVVPEMVAAGSGTVINIGAAGHVQGHAHMAAYAVGKGAVMRLTESMAEELSGSGVSVFCLMPTIIDTPQNRLDMPNADFSTWTPAADIGELMVLLTSRAAALMSGSSIPLKGRVPGPSR